MHPEVCTVCPPEKQMWKLKGTAPKATYTNQTSPSLNLLIQLLRVQLPLNILQPFQLFLLIQNLTSSPNSFVPQLPFSTPCLPSIPLGSAASHRSTFLPPPPPTPHPSPSCGRSVPSGISLLCFIPFAQDKIQSPTVAYKAPP